MSGDQEPRFAFRASDKHCNTGGTVHGGMLVTFADFALCAIAAWDRLDQERCVTVSLNCDFTAPGHLGELIEAHGEIVRRTKSLAFVRGLVHSPNENLLSFTGVTKRFSRSP